LTVGGNNGSTEVSGIISGTGGSLVKAGTGTLTLSGANTYTGGTTLAGGTVSVGSDANLGDAAGALTFNGGTLRITGTSFTSTARAVNLAAGGGSLNIVDGANTLTVSHSIGGTGGLTKLGAGTLVLTGFNSYAGATIVNGGTLEIDGALTGTSSVTVNAGGRLTGTGTIDPLTVTIGSGGMLIAGNGTAGTSTRIEGNLALESGALYGVALNPATSSFTGVTGTATLGGATVNASWASGAYVAKQYTILTAKSVSGTFGTTVNTNLPSGFKTVLSYDPSDVCLNLSLLFVGPPGNGLNVNQQKVANAVTGFFNKNGSIPLVFGGLTPAGLTQISGEGPTAAQQTMFDAMGLFMGVMTDPFTDGRGNAGASGGAMSYAADTASEHGDAYGAIATKAPQALSFEQRWNVWASGFGGTQTTDGNAALGSNNATSHIFGTAVGADYRFSPDTLAGFALAGGGTSFSVANGGSGRSDLFQAGAYVRHNINAAYISAALAYGWQDITIDRSVIVAGVDRLRAEFNANAFSGRVEGGYRFVTPWMAMGITPYAAAQFATFDQPAYAESVVSGASTFALAYGAKTVTDSRSELGLRTDQSFAMQNSVLTLRGRAAWSHDFDPDRSIGATFLTLPGASFVVNGAAQAHDSALTTASAEMKWLNGWSTAATFEGEFSGVTRSYAGKGVVRYAW
jgi:autotransporter-associated beta strand protein